MSTDPTFDGWMAAYYRPNHLHDDTDDASAPDPGTTDCTGCDGRAEVWVGPDRNDYGTCGVCHGHGYLNELGLPPGGAQ